MNSRDRLLAVLVAVLWGLNFLAVRIGLDHYPPFFFAAMRYFLLVIPVVLFVPRPKVAFRWLLLYGLGFGAVQFAFVYLAIEHGMPTGLSSLVLQASAPFTVILGWALLHERINRWQGVGIGLAVVGIGLIAVDRAQSAALLPVGLTLIGALGWAGANLATRKANAPNPLHFSLWMSVVPPIPLLALSAVAEGPAKGWVAFGRSFSSDGWPGLVAVAFIILMGTVAGSTIWTALLARHPASEVAPFSLLVPVVGLAGAWLALHERPGVLSLIGGVVVILGVLVGLPRRATVPVAGPDGAARSSESQAAPGVVTNARA
jgi:drug/metabolite transporter (DMT)-like permease